MSGRRPHQRASRTRRRRQQTWAPSCPKPRNARCEAPCRTTLPPPLPSPLPSPPLPTILINVFYGHLQVLEYEQSYLHTLPLTDMYEKSYMHRDIGNASCGTLAPLAGC